MNQEQKKIALITGAGRGIGRAIAIRLATDGFYTVLIARQGSELNETLALVRERGGTGETLTLNVANQAAVNQAIANLSSIDILVNNAGRGGGGKTVTLDDDVWHDVIQTNLHSVYYMSKAVIANNKIKKPGAIINIASTGGKQGVVHAAAYSASKHGVVGFTKSLGLELAKDDITVNCVCPGFVETSMAERVRGAYAKIWEVDVNEAKKRIEARVPIGRYIEPQEVAAMVAFLASPEARGITAQAMNVCGGLGNY